MILSMTGFGKAVVIFNAVFILNKIYTFRLQNSRQDYSKFQDIFSKLFIIFASADGDISAIRYARYGMYI